MERADNEARRRKYKDEPAGSKYGGSYKYKEVKALQRHLRIIVVVDYGAGGKYQKANCRTQLVS